MPHLSLLCFCPRDLGCCGGGVDGAGVPCGLCLESVLFGVGEGLAHPAGRVPVAGDDGAGAVACGFGVGAGGEPVPGGGWGQCLQVGDGDHEPVGWVEDRGHWPSPSSAASRRSGPSCSHAPFSATGGSSTGSSSTLAFMASIDRKSVV